MEPTSAYSRTPSLLAALVVLALSAVAFGSAPAVGHAIPAPGAGALAALQGIDGPRVDPEIAALLESITADSLRAHVAMLTSVETRHTFSDKDPAGNGIGAAREKIKQTYESFGGRLQVWFDAYQVQADGRRVAVDTDLRNVVATLPGSGASADRLIIVSGHYDSAARGGGQRGARGQDPGQRPAPGSGPAPGANDDGSGTAVSIELARVMANMESEATVHFMTVAGEEIGLVGATLMAQRLKSEGANVEAMITNDIVGSPRGGDGQFDNTRVRVFSDGPEDSLPRALARYFRRTAHAYLPAFTIDTIFRFDRFGRGGDHTPFVLEGYAGVRVTESHENYARQHTTADTIDGVDFDYLAQVARANGAVIASMANAPAPPNVFDDRGSPMLGRGQDRYAANMRWQPSDAPDLSHYVVVMRKTTSPFWERSWNVGNVTEFELADVSIDDWTFGVMAVDRDGHESLIASYVNAPRERRTYEVVR